jgi:polyphosphate kinase
MAKKNKNGNKAGDHFFDRELSWLEFNLRVLLESENPAHSLLERLKFSAIFSSNLDEFFMVRVAGLKRLRRAGGAIRSLAGFTPRQQLDRIGTRVEELIAEQYASFRKTLLPLLKESGIDLVYGDRATHEQIQYGRTLFEEEIFPCLTPVALEPEKEFPFKGNLKLYLGFLLESPDDGKERIAVLQVPAALNRLQAFPKGGHTYLLLEDIILRNAALLFPGYAIREHVLFRVTRDADLSVDESRDEDFLEAMQEMVQSRERSAPVRLEISRGSNGLKDVLRRVLSLEQEEIYEIDGPLDLGLFMKLLELEGYDERRDRSWQPQHPEDLSEENGLFETLSNRDVLLAHPYESFEPVVRFVQEAARDPRVLAVKMTLYRTSGDSPIIKALVEAAQAGKQVTVLVELKARFDEEKNIGWAQELEQAGVIVLYGIAGLKVHAKALMVIRREAQGIRRYVHLGTGNYNEKTARQYTDLGLMSCREGLAHDLALFFNTITGYSIAPTFRKLVMAPVNLRERLGELIKREARQSSQYNPGLIMLKMNALVDVKLIQTLYKASQAGVRVLLNVRGICCLRPGIKGLSENIRVVSVVDHFLEHSRIFYFRNDGNEEIYLSSADLMPRNLDRRVELMFPIEDEEHKRRLIALLEQTFRDNQNAHELGTGGSYTRSGAEKGREAVRSQTMFQQQAMLNAQELNGKTRRAFKVRRKIPNIRI